MAGRDGLLSGGLHGPALVPGDPEASLLLRAVRYTDRHLRMPPERPLDEAAVLDLEQWIAMGAPWPDYAGPSASEHADPLDIAGARERWPFTELVRPPVPAAPEGARAIDAFVQARLAEAGLEPSPPATEAELVRRVYHDLLGLPPSYDELEAYLADARLDRWERLVEELLARPEYGERWARRWLDLVRYAQTNGFERDEEKPYAWRYRDWVVDAFNADMPYNRFVKLQLAGDELANSSAEGIVATGFYRLGPWDAEPDDPVQAEFDELDDVVRVIGEGLLGLTLGCARCHDHEFDPIAQEDYYAVLANLRGLRRMEQAVFWPDSSMVRPLGADRHALDSWREELRARRVSLNRELDAMRQSAFRAAVQARFQGQEQLISAILCAPEERTPQQHAQVAEVSAEIPSQRDMVAGMAPVDRRRAILAQVELDRLKTSFEGQVEWALSVRETLPTPDTQLLVRGRASSPGEQVQPGFPAVACPDDAAARPALTPAPAASESSGRRTALANWITSPRNPLSSRVIANRVWQHLFGEGIVRTPNDFGAQGAPPTPPELLDWLASELIEQRGSLKALQREILLSNTYRQSSRTRAARALELDPANELLWRQNPRRLEAEAVRDALLLRAGELASGSPGRGYFPALGRETLASM